MIPLNNFNLKKGQWISEATCEINNREKWNLEIVLKVYRLSWTFLSVKEDYSDPEFKHNTCIFIFN